MVSIGVAGVLAGAPMAFGHPPLHRVARSILGPTVVSLTPRSGSPSGGAKVHILGSGFSKATRVLFGRRPARSVQVLSARSLNVVAPPGEGTVNVTVRTPQGTSVASGNARFEFARLDPSTTTAVASISSSAPAPGGTASGGGAGPNSAPTGASSTSGTAVSDPSTATTTTTTTLPTTSGAALPVMSGGVAPGGGGAAGGGAAGGGGAGGGGGAPVVGGAPAPGGASGGSPPPTPAPPTTTVPPATTITPTATTTPAPPTTTTTPPSSGVQPLGSAPGPWALAFDDEFNGSSLNTSNWSEGWGTTSQPGFSPPVNTEESDCYNPSQVTESGGTLNISLIDQACLGHPYTTGLISTNGKYEFTYGYLEARIYLPASGTEIANWPAFWADGQDPWPTNGELDVMEGLSGRACYHFHSPSGAPGNCGSGNFSGWHTYGAEWQPGSVTYYYDGTDVGTITLGITAQPMFLIFDYAIDNEYGGPHVVPSTMQVDYVRVWQHSVTENAHVRSLARRSPAVRANKRVPATPVTARRRRRPLR